jgi:hypothetical protein
MKLFAVSDTEARRKPALELRETKLVVVKGALAVRYDLDEELAGRLARIED